MAAKNDDAVAELMFAFGLLIRKVRAQAPGDLNDLSWTQKSVITRLDKDGPVTTAELARAEGVKPQSMGTAVSALEALGLIERIPHPTDGRQFNIALTTQGKTMRKRAKDAKLTWLAEAVNKLSKRDQETLVAAGAVMKRLVEL